MKNNTARDFADASTGTGELFGDELSAADKAKLRQLSYLVVGGDRAARAAAVGHLRALGAREMIETDSSGRALLEVEKGAFDVLLIGEDLPDMSGSDLAWCLKHSRDKRLRKISPVPMGHPAERGTELYLRILQEIYAPNPRQAPLSSGFKVH
jgi:hypothetical protein